MHKSHQVWIASSSLSCDTAWIIGLLVALVLPSFAFKTVTFHSDVPSSPDTALCRGLSSCTLYKCPVSGKNTSH
ncbi:hypothetical protein TYRP_019298 [Tyrophagus putrescentiae]|nr:hypothetical protein TYRP_019298 [Tyrophagus putrescentiae]